MVTLDVSGKISGPLYQALCSTNTKGLSTQLCRYSASVKALPKPMGELLLLV